MPRRATVSPRGAEGGFFGVHKAGRVFIALARPLDFVGWRPTTPQLAPKGKSRRDQPLRAGRMDSFDSAVMAYQP